MTTRIINPKGIRLSTSIVKLLEIMFKSLPEVVIDAELKPNEGDSHIFVVLVEKTHRTDYLVVKIAPSNLIKQEWTAYQRYIPKKLRGITEIEGFPVFLPNEHIGGLKYPLVGNNEYKIETLLEYCKREKLHNIISDIFEDELFENLQFLWGRGNLQTQYSFYKNYSHLLPYYLILEEDTPASERNIFTVDLSSISDQTFVYGDYVRVVNARISSIYEKENSITVKPIDNNLGNRILYTSRRDLSSIHLDDIVEQPLIGRVQKTRNEQIAEYAEMALKRPYDSKSKWIRLDNDVVLPNPLAYLDSILHKLVNVRFACIHGDLHLENILVEHYEDPIHGSNHLAHLIDFDNSRRDHVLRDSLELESRIVTELLSDSLGEENLQAETIYAFYKEIHNAIVYGNHDFSYKSIEKPFALIISLRKLAHYYLFKPDDWTEYYYGLFIYFLGMLKFQKASSSSKMVGFLAAAAILSLLLENNDTESKSG